MKCYLLIFHLVFFGVFQISAFADGDPFKGKALYATCVACHGQDGEGLEEPDQQRLFVRELGVLQFPIAPSHPDEH